MEGQALKAKLMYLAVVVSYLILEVSLMTEVTYLTRGTNIGAALGTLVGSAVCFWTVNRQPTRWESAYYRPFVFFPMLVLVLILVSGVGGLTGFFAGGM
jgi:hypothetical protein